MLYFWMQAMYMTETQTNMEGKFSSIKLGNIQAESQKFTEWSALPYHFSSFREFQTLFLDITRIDMKSVWHFKVKSLISGF